MRRTVGGEGVRRRAGGERGHLGDDGVEQTSKSGMDWDTLFPAFSLPFGGEGGAVGMGIIFTLSG